MRQERRNNRSYNVQEALELQLAETARRGSFSSVMLAENQGIPVAAAGNIAANEEICALAPSLVPGKRLWKGKIAIDNGPEKFVTIAPVKTEIGNLYLCGVGGDSSKVIAELLNTTHGINRILA